MLNTGYFPDYLKIARLNLLSKTNKTGVTLEQIRPIAILPHIAKAIERALKNRLDKSGSKLFTTGDY
jgi:hypothetical protein